MKTADSVFDSALGSCKQLSDQEPEKEVSLRPSLSLSLPRALPAFLSVALVITSAPRTVDPSAADEARTQAHTLEQRRTLSGPEEIVEDLPLSKSLCISADKGKITRICPTGVKGSSSSSSGHEGSFLSASLRLSSSATRDPSAA